MRTFAHNDYWFGILPTRSHLKVFCQGRYQRREIRDNELERLQKELREQADAASKRVVRQITPSLMRSGRQVRFRNSFWVVVPIFVFQIVWRWEKPVSVLLLPLHIF